MRIALDCRSVFPGRGGIGRYTEELARHLPQAAPEHQFVLLTTPRQKAQLNTAPNVTQLTVPAAMIDPTWEQLHLPTLLKDQAIDLYHATCFALPVVRTVPAAVATVHDVVFRAQPELVAPALRVYLDTWTAHTVETANAIVTVPAYSKHAIKQYYGHRISMGSFEGFSNRAKDIKCHAHGYLTWKFTGSSCASFTSRVCTCGMSPISLRYMLVLVGQCG